MKTIPSHEFRKEYAKLTDSVVVTVYGHPMGIWQPYSAEIRAQYVIDTESKVQTQEEPKEETAK